MFFFNQCHEDFSGSLSQLEKGYPPQRGPYIIIHTITHKLTKDWQKSYKSFIEKIPISAADLHSFTTGRQGNWQQLCWRCFPWRKTWFKIREQWFRWGSIYPGPPLVAFWSFLTISCYLAPKGICFLPWGVSSEGWERDPQRATRSPREGSEFVRNILKISAKST